MQAHESVNLPQVLPLWPEGRAPRSLPEDEGFPTFTYYLPSPEHRAGPSVLILPGGGYGLVSTAKEGHRPAMWFSAHGIAAAVLEYRHSPQRHPVPLLDAQRGLRLLRHLALHNGLSQNAVGVMGFSAGGHLAGCLATLPELSEGKVGDDPDATPCRPDFAALVYPVTSLVAPHAHGGSRGNLLGADAPDDLAAGLSLENAVKPGAPPFFLFHTQEDLSVPPAHSLELYATLTRHNIPAELHVYAKGAHGIGMSENHPWAQLLLDWLAKLQVKG